jgi:hypothetical protein
MARQTRMKSTEVAQARRYVASQIKAISSALESLDRVKPLGGGRFLTKSCEIDTSGWRETEELAKALEAARSKLGKLRARLKDPRASIGPRFPTKSC